MDNCDSTPGGSSCKCGWLGRNWKWFVPVLLLAIFVICGGLAVALFAAFIGKGELLEVYRADVRIKASQPFQMALEKIRADAEVVKQLGEPIEPVELASGEVPAETDDGKPLSGNANFYFDLAGPKGTASVFCQGKMIDGKWGLSILKVTFADGSRHSVEVSGGDDSLHEAPAWSP